MTTSHTARFEEAKLRDLAVGQDRREKLPFSSSEASSATSKRRSKTLAEARKHISGGDSSVQMQSELKSLTQQEREEVLADAHLPIVLPVDHSLAMKADLVLTWGKLGVINRHHKT